MLEGRNIWILDTETRRPALECRKCGYGKDRHVCREGMDPEQLWCTGRERMAQVAYDPILWTDFRELGLSIGCYWDGLDGLVHWFDQGNLLEILQALRRRRPLLVTFNGERFDLPLLATVLAHTIPPGQAVQALPMIALFEPGDRSYDLLAQIGTHHPHLYPFDRLHSLDKLCEANGLPRKEMTGYLAPVAWAQGHIAAVLNYCQMDVIRTKLLFEKVLRGEPLRRLDGVELRLPPPVGLG